MTTLAWRQRHRSHPGRSYYSTFPHEYGHQKKVRKLLFAKLVTWSFNRSRNTISSVINSFPNIAFEELNGDNINSLTNVITLDNNLHTIFGSLGSWFEPIPVRCLPLRCVIIDAPERNGPTLTNQQIRKANKDFLRQSM